MVGGGVSWDARDPRASSGDISSPTRSPTEIRSACTNRAFPQCAVARELSSWRGLKMRNRNGRFSPVWVRRCMVKLLGCENALAMPARKWLFSGVGPHVLLPRICLRKTAAALGALKRLVSSVDPQVLKVHTGLALGVPAACKMHSTKGRHVRDVTTTDGANRYKKRPFRDPNRGTRAAKDNVLHSQSDQKGTAHHSHSHRHLVRVVTHHPPRSNRPLSMARGTQSSAGLSWVAARANASARYEVYRSIENSTAMLVLGWTTATRWESIAMEAARYTPTVCASSTTPTNALAM
jgi:hypothetical protein